MSAMRQFSPLLHYARIHGVLPFSRLNYSSNTISVTLRAKLFSICLILICVTGFCLNLHAMFIKKVSKELDTMLSHQSIFLSWLFARIFSLASMLQILSFNGNVKMVEITTKKLTTVDRLLNLKNNQRKELIRVLIILSTFEFARFFYFSIVFNALNLRAIISICSMTLTLIIEGFQNTIYILCREITHRFRQINLKLRQLTKREISRERMLSIINICKFAYLEMADIQENVQKNLSVYFFFDLAHNFLYCISLFILFVFAIGNEDSRHILGYLFVSVSSVLRFFLVTSGCGSVATQVSALFFFTDCFNIP
jgi:hypothetical protein